MRFLSAFVLLLAAFALPLAARGVTFSAEINSADADWLRQRRLPAENAAFATAARARLSVPTNLSASVVQDLLVDWTRLTEVPAAFSPFCSTTKTDRGLRLAWAVPDDVFARAYPSWEAVVRRLSEPASYTAPGFHPLAAMEIAPLERHAALRAAFVRPLYAQLSAVAARYLSDGLRTSYSPRLASGLSIHTLHTSTTEDLFLLLDELPGDPRIVVALATRLEREGRPVAASWIAARPLASFIDPPAAEACRRLAAQRPEFTPSEADDGGLQEMVGALAAETNFRGTALEIYDAWRRPFPGGTAAQPPATDLDFAAGVELLKAERPDYGAAFDCFAASVANRISFPACVCAGECAFACGRYSEAAMLFWQALCTRPTDQKIRPWVYLARLAAKFGRPAEMRACLGQVAALKPDAAMTELLRAECGYVPAAEEAK